MNIERIRQPFIKKFPGDFSNNLMQRNTPKVLFATTQPAGFDKPALIAFNETLAEEIGLGKFEEKDLNFLAGNQLLITFRRMQQPMQDISLATGPDSLETEEPFWRERSPMKQEKNGDPVERSRCNTLFQTRRRKSRTEIFCSGIPDERSHVSSGSSNHAGTKLGTDRRRCCT